MIYHTEYCFNAYDLYETFDKTQLKIKRETVQNKYGVNKKQTFCGSVFSYCMYLILLDIIENNTTFVLPLFKNKNASIFVKPVTDNQLKIARQNGAFSGIDLLCSNFTAYKIIYSWQNKKGLYERPVYINNTLKEKFYNNINNGKQYY